jgi:hypothetical protein
MYEASNFQVNCPSASTAHPNRDPTGDNLHELQKRIPFTGQGRESKAGYFRVLSCLEHY